MILGYFFIIGAAVCWGLIGIFSSLAFAQGVEPMEVAFWRACLTWFFFGIYAVIRRETRIDPRDIPLFFLFSVFGVCLFYISYQYAVKTAGAAFASVLLYTAPSWVILGSYFLFKERLTWIKGTALCLVLVGVFFIAKTGGNANADVSLSFWAVISGLTSGLCYSLYYIIGKHFAWKYSSANLFVYVLPVGALLILPFVDFAHKTPLAWTALFALSFISTFLAYGLYYMSLKRLEAGRASIVATLEPVVAAVSAYFFLGERFTLLGYFGAFLILAAVIATIREK